MSNERKPKGGAPKLEREEQLRDLPAPKPDSQDNVRGGRTPAAPSPVPLPYPN